MIATQTPLGSDMAKKKKAAYEVGSYRMQVRLPDDWKEALEEAADEAGVTPSEFVRRAIRSKLPASIRKGLGDVSVGRPPIAEEDE